MTHVRAVLIGALQLLASNPNATVFVIGLTVLCASVARWSGPLAGSIAGVVLMLVAVYPFLVRRKSEE